jgi:hypothetical protein
MSDEQTTVDAGSETSGDTAAVATSQEKTAAVETTEPTTEPATGAVESTDDAGGAADETTVESTEIDPNVSRTDFVGSAARTGDACTCPDGRPGTVTVFAGNLAVCLPNQG